ncbi:transporter substrate-binding domain-containing protein [Rhizobium sp. 32-5/1]|uniref:substrate-binding periplasmic protein n=1 Tax=Rhizobium sp. 32-5/1 TaxID=3019602 RepID=UPI00240D216D|nr:transporter substrate-binding domain-containing protein [Rhizobium sp. 32-5/1]WEZ82936.1 transporter substrate-binding domain-containing protein [Rhizobium sp. 32-5/1]
MLFGIAQAEPLKLLTEEYRPYNFSDDGKPSGASVEQADLIMTALGIEYSIEILPWARAFSMAESQPSTCVFTTGHDHERSARFKWVMPLLVDRMVMLKKAGSSVNPLDVEDAKRFTIGTQREDFSSAYLRNNNFTKIDLAVDMEATLKKLLSDRIDLMMTSEKTFETMRTEGTQVEAALTLDGKLYGFACNLAVADTTILSHANRTGQTDQKWHPGPHF